MTKIKKDSSGGKRMQLVVNQNKKKGVPSVWDHHDTMIVNLRQWVDRELELLEVDIGKHARSVAGKPRVAAALKRATELNTQLWDAVREAQEMAAAAKETT